MSILLSQVLLLICPFTGEVAGFPWWENTWAIYVLGESGIVVYGEIQLNFNLDIGDEITTDTNIGSVLKVLKKDKGRPTSMLHIELHKPTHTHIGKWLIGENMPEGYIDPTEHLKSILGRRQRF